MSGERTNVPSDNEILHDGEPVTPPPDPVAIYERMFRENRDEANENGYDLICVLCGCGIYDSDDESLHDIQAHRLYDAIKVMQRG